MIIQVKVSPKLKIKLSRYNVELVIRELIANVGNEALLNVMEYGEGANRESQKPFGGAPYWQGQVKVSGHYRGYLSNSHYIRNVNPFHAQIVSSSGFAYGVIQGQSTNWTTRDGGFYVFTPNPYHKRAADKLRKEGRIQTIWRNVSKGNLV